MKVFKLKFVIYSIMLGIILTLMCLYIYIKQDEVNIPNNISFINTVLVGWTLIFALNTLYIAYEIFSIQNYIILAEKLILKYKYEIDESEKELNIYESEFDSMEIEEDTEEIKERINNVKKRITTSREKIALMEEKIENYQRKLT